MPRFYLGYLRFMKDRVRGEAEVIELAREYSRILRVPIEIEVMTAGVRPKGAYYSVLLTRSPHGQVITYNPTKHDRYRGRRYISPVLEDEISISIQEQALAEVKRLDTNGTFTCFFDLELKLVSIETGLTFESLWTLDFAAISHFENAVRGANDLPLGNSEMFRKDWLVLEYEAPHGLDMTKPYLHLFAHNPNYRIKQLTVNRGVVSTFGKELLQQVQHAVDYLEGVIDE